MKLSKTLEMMKERNLPVESCEMDNDKVVIKWAIQPDDYQMEIARFCIFDKVSVHQW